MFGKFKKEKTETKSVKKTAKKAKQSKKSTKKKSSMGEKVSHVIKLVTDEQYLQEMTYGKISKKAINFVKIFIASFRKFKDDDCFTKSTAITYTALMSLIPILTVALTFASFFKDATAQKAEITLKITRTLAEYGLQQLQVEPFVEAILGLVDNAASIGGIGAAVLIFSATALLRNLEDSLNAIWQVKKQRAIFLKIVYYWAALTLGPLLFFAGTTIATQVSAALSSPDYHQVLIENNRMYLAGSKATLGYRKTASFLEEKTVTLLNDTIDFNNQRIYTYNSSTNLFEADTTSELKELDLNKIAFFDIEKNGSTIWAAGDKGILLKSDDNGKNWKITKLGFYKLTDIHMFDQERGMIISDRGVILKTVDGGQIWEVTKFDSLDENLNAIAFSGNTGFVVADKGYLAYTYDGGESWAVKQLEEAKEKKYFSSLYTIEIKDSKIVITGENGIVLTSTNAGYNWQRKQFNLENNSASLIVSKSSYYIGTEKGTLLYTEDDGVNWSIIKNGTQSINQIFLNDKKLMIAGSSGMLQITEDEGLTWLGKSGKTVSFYVLNFLAPFVVIWLLFLLVYIAMPNTSVSFKAASLGAAFTGSLWVAFIFFFIIYVKAFANGTFAIYGALAAFPIFLLMVYTSIIIILLGAEVSYTIMHPFSYKNLKKKKLTHDEISVINGLRILHLVYNKFEDGKGKTHYDDLVKLCSYNNRECEFFIDLFKENKLLLEQDNNNYLPANSSANISLANVVNMIQQLSFRVTAAQTDPVRAHLAEKFQQMSEANENILGTDTLMTIIETSKE